MSATHHEPQSTPKSTPEQGRSVWLPPGYELVTENSSGNETSPHLKDYLVKIWAGRWYIILIFLICVGLTAWRTMRTIPIYEAVARIQIEPETLDLITMGDLAISRNKDDQYIETQRQVLLSRPLAEKVIAGMELRVDASKPSALGHLKGAVASVARRFVPKGGGDAEDITPEELALRKQYQMVEKFHRNLTVDLLRGTQILEVRYRDRDPQYAAGIVNALCGEYIDWAYQSRIESYGYASEWLLSRLDEYKAKLELSEEQLYESAGKDLLPLTDDATQMVLELDAMRRRIAEAEKTAFDKEYEWRQVSEADDIDSILIDKNPRMSDLIRNLHETEVKLSSMSQQYGPRMNEIKMLDASRRQLLEQLASERKGTRARIRQDWQAAQAALENLQGTYEKRRHEVMRIQQGLIQYRILKREVDVNSELYNDLLQRSKEVGVSAGIKPSNVTILEKAQAPIRYKFPNKKRNYGLGVMMGLLLGVGLVFFLDYMDTTVKSAEDIERLFHLATFGVVPTIHQRREKAVKQNIPLMSQDSPNSIFTEQIRTVRTALRYSLAGRAPRTVLITSAMPSEGKTSIAINLAITFAQHGRRVLLIDADLKRSSIHKFFAVDRRRGLAECLTGELSLQEASQATNVPGLFVITSGDNVPNPVELLDSDIMRELIANSAQEYDQVIIDTAPTMDMADTNVLTPFVDGVLLVIRPGKTQLAALHNCKSRIDRVHGRILGVVLNNPGRKTTFVRYDNYYYGSYGYQEEKGSPTTAQASDGA